MYWGHRADYVPQNAAHEFVHKNLPNSDSVQVWNSLYVCFLPARYVGGVKVKNAYLRTKVNDEVVFDGEVKSGTRAARHTSNQDPEPAVYGSPPNGDKKIRLLGHWGSKVMYKSILIKSVGSKP